MPDWQAILKQAAARDQTGGVRSPASEWLSFPQLQNWGEGWAESEWEVEERALNSRGTLFGGYHGVLADTVLSMATMTVVEDSEHFVTSDLRISYFRPIVKGRVRLRAEVIHRTRNLIHVDADFKDDDGVLLARASAVMGILQS